MTSDAFVPIPMFKFLRILLRHSTQPARTPWSEIDLTPEAMHIAQETVQALQRTAARSIRIREDANGTE